MRKLLTVLTLAPAPLFFLGFLYSTWANLLTPQIHGISIQLCSAVTLGHSHSSMQWEMPVMWFVMFLSHTASWIVWHSQRQRSI